MTEVARTNMQFAGADPIEEENLSDGAAFLQADDGVPTVEDDVAPAVPEPVPTANTDPEQETAAVPAEGATPPVESAETPPVETEAAADVPAEAPEDVDPDGGASVPSFRLAQESARRRTAEARVQEMEDYLNSLQQQPAATQPQQPAQQDVPAATPEGTSEDAAALGELSIDFGDNAKQMFDKALDGDIDTANQLFSDMVNEAATKAAQAAIAASPAASGQQDVSVAVEQQLQYNNMRNDEMVVIESLEQQVTAFNPNSPDFNKDLVNETLAIQNAYVQQNFTPADAMKRAASMTLAAHGITVAAAPVPASDANSAQVQRNVAANNQQPPIVPVGAGNKVPDVDISAMSEEEFDALPEATIARLRGDFA